MFALARVGPLALAVVLLLSGAAPSRAERVALVIGNAAYEQTPLRNPVNDARSMSEKLKSLGFSVVLRENLKTRQIGSTLREFRSKLNPGDEALFFYAGHGVQLKGINYLPAVDAEINGEEDVPLQSISVSDLLVLMDESKAGIKLVFLDACRNNPFARSFRGGDRGLSRIGNAPSGTLISFATHPGSVAADGIGLHGIYTEQLLNHIGTEGVPIEQVLKQVSVDVERESNGEQEPWTEGSIRGDFYFRAALNQTAIDTQPSGRSRTAEEIEDEYWDRIRSTSDAEAFGGYLNHYPSGRYRALAEAEVARLRAENRRLEPIKETPPAQTTVPAKTGDHSMLPSAKSTCSTDGITCPMLQGSSSRSKNHLGDKLFTYMYSWALPFSTTSDLIAGRDLFAIANPSDFGNPESMVAKAARLQVERERPALSLVTQR